MFQVQEKKDYLITNHSNRVSPGPRVSPPCSGTGSSESVDWNFSDNMGLSSEMTPNGDVRAETKPSLSSSDNHHGESPFSNSDSVSSFTDKPTDFTAAAAYSQLYQSGMGGYAGGSYLPSSSFYNGGQAYPATAAAVLSQAYPGSRGQCKGSSGHNGATYLYSPSPFTGSSSGSCPPGLPGAGYGNYPQIPPSYSHHHHHAQDGYSQYSSTFHQSSSSAASSAAAAAAAAAYYSGHSGGGSGNPPVSSYYYNSASSPSTSSVTGSYPAIPNANPTIPDSIGYLPGEPSSPTPTIKESKVRRARQGGRGRRPNPSPDDPEHNLERVFIWDLDETIIIFHTLLSGHYGHRFHTDTARAQTLGAQLEEFIFNLSDTHFFFNDLEECDQVHIDDLASDDNGLDLSTYDFSSDSFKSSSPNGSICLNTGGRNSAEWNRKLAYRYRKIKEFYSTHRANVGEIMSAPLLEKWHHLRNEIEALTDNWLSWMLKCLQIVNSRPNSVNILVTQTSLVIAFAKVLLHGLGPIFPIENVYSCTKNGTDSTFQRIINRFGRRCTYLVIGDGAAEEEVSKKMNFPFWRISTHKDVVALHQVMELGFL